MENKKTRLRDTKPTKHKQLLLYYNITLNIATFYRVTKDHHQITHSLKIVPGGSRYIGMLNV